MVRVGTRECQVVTILDADGIPLTVALAGPVDEQGTITFTEVDDHGALIDYYFGRGERLVVVERDGTTLEGLLDTRWQTVDRVWWVGINEPHAIPSLVPAPARETTPVHQEMIQNKAVRA